MKNIIFAILLINSILWVSCNEFLEIRPKGIVIPETCEDYERLLNNPKMVSTTNDDPIYMTDDAFMPYGDDHLSLETRRMPLQNLYKYSSAIFGESEADPLWDYSYSRIFTYNTVANAVMSSTNATEEYKSQIRAEALLGRSFEYLTLINIYAKHYDKETANVDPGVPLLLEATVHQKEIVRASVQEVYMQIQADLQEAVDVLPEKPQLSAFRGSKPAALALLARVHLYMGNYAEALRYAKLLLEKNSSLLDLKLYKVESVYKQRGRLKVPDATEDNPENIYSRVDQKSGLSGQVYGSPDLIKKFDQKNDKRFLLYFTKRIGKAEYKHDLWAPYLRANTGLATPEVYLIAAECEARIGDKDAAMKYIDKLRDNRILNNTPLTATSNEHALFQVLDERRRELTMNGCMRLIDLKRLNRDSRFAKEIIHTTGGVDYKLVPNDPKYVLPIPPRVMSYNPNMIPNNR